MKENVKFIIQKFLNFILSGLVCAAVMALIFLDLHFFKGIPERSFVEFGQATLLLITSLIYMYLAQRKNANGLWLVAGFFLCMFIRELDAYFDLVFHGAWVFVAIPCAIVFVCIAWKKGRDNALCTLAKFMDNPSFPMLANGLLTIFVFSRIMGFKPLWKTIMGKHFMYSVKAVTEEGTELFGYAFIFVSTLNYTYNLLKEKVDK